MLAAALALYSMSALLLAAHFLRSLDLPGLIASLAFPLLFMVRRPWALRLLQAGAVISAAIWVWTALAIREARVIAGQPWGRMFLILGAVALFSLLPLPMLAGQVANNWFAGVRRKRNSSLQ